MPDWNSENYLKEQSIFLLAICARLLDNWDVMHHAYRELKEGIRVKANFKVANQTCGLLLMPLEKSRQKVESAIQSFIELVLFNN